VVFADWTVACFDSSLRLLWMKAVAHKTFSIEQLIRDYRIRDVALYVGPLQVGDSEGVVVVGASMARRTPIVVGTDSEVLDGGSVYAGTPGNAETAELLKNYARGLLRQKEAQAAPLLEHFSMFALEAESGHVLWRHDGLELATEQFSRALPAHAYSLDLRDLMTQAHHAGGASDWMVFRLSLLEELPHAWNDAPDTFMRIAHFVRRHVGASAGTQIHKAQAKKKAQKHKHKDTHAGKGRNGKTATQLHSMPLLQGEVPHTLEPGAHLPHDAAEHTASPNVLVAHTQRGLEVVALRTGVPITALALAPGRTYADVDGDGVVDTISVLGDDEGVAQHRSEFSQHQYEFATGPGLQRCSLVVMSGLPARSQLFNGSVCADRPSLRDPFAGRDGPVVGSGTKSKDRPSGSADAQAQVQHLRVSHAPPLVLRKLNKDTGRESLERDVVVALHSGVVTSYAGSGAFNWQVRTAPRWTDAVEAAARRLSNSNTTSGEGGKGVEGEGSTSAGAALLAFDSDATRAAERGSHNCVWSSILVAGESSLLLLSREGDALASAEIPRPPVAPPVLGDFDNDGVTDIIVTTDGAVLGYHVHVRQASRGVLVALLLLAAVAVVIFVANIQNVPCMPSSSTESTTHTSSSSSSTGLAAAPRASRPAPKSKSRFQIVRSTDDQHLD